MMKKISLSLLAIAAVSALVAGGTFALFTASATNAGNTFTAGTVTLAATAHTTLDITNIAPGDSGSDPYEVTYTGSLRSFIGVDADATGTLLACDGANSLQLNINGHALSSDAGAMPDWQVAGDVAPGSAHTFTLNWSLPAAAGNACQGKSATVDMTVSAVQSKNNDTTSDGIADSWASTLH